MRSLSFIGLTLVGVALLVGGCSTRWSSWVPSFADTSPARAPETKLDKKKQVWRAKSERACLASGRVRTNRFISTRSSLGRLNGVCGAIRPFKVSAADNGRVTLRPAATLRCPMIPALDRWTRDVLSPAAVELLGSPVVNVRVAASYACRPINHKRGNKLSEHGRANAIDISAFTLKDGRVVTVKRGWRNATRAEAKFLRRLHRGACRIFTTVLGPNADRYHHDHFHFDLARHGRTGTYRVCR